MKNEISIDNITGHWYMLGADGKMFSGLITDNSTGKSYLLNINHDGTFGRMITADGNYNVNGKQIELKFNQAHDGTFGAITSGLDSVRGAGVNETKLASIPTDNGRSSSGSQQQNNINKTSDSTIDTIDSKKLDRITERLKESGNETEKRWANSSLEDGREENSGRIDGEGLTVGDLSGFTPMH